MCGVQRPRVNPSQSHAKPKEFRGSVHKSAEAFGEAFDVKDLRLPFVVPCAANKAETPYGACTWCKSGVPDTALWHFFSCGKLPLEQVVPFPFCLDALGDVADEPGKAWRIGRHCGDRHLNREFVPVGPNSRRLHPAIDERSDAGLQKPIEAGPVTFAKAGTYEYLCTIPGHAAGGMKGLLKVT